MDFLIAGGRVLDPSSRRDGIFDLLVKNGKIASIEKNISAPKNTAKISARGCWVMPGLIDAHVHLREPGGEESETIASGTQAAAAGGVTSVLAMANTKPPIDSPQQVRFVLRRAKETAIVRVYPVGAVTKNLEGKELADIAGMVKAGCAAISDDGREVMDTRLYRRALELAKAHRVPLIDHCEDENLSMGGVMNESSLSAKLGLRGIPPESESVMVARAIFLSRLTGARVHLAHMSTKDSVDLIRNAKKNGVPVSAETCPHYLTLTEDAVQRYKTSAKMKPPLRSHKDQNALLEGLSDGTLDTIATDHAPHDPRSKEREFSQAPFGIIGLETSFALVHQALIETKVLTPMEAVRKMSFNPAENFGLPGGSISKGAVADLAIFDPGISWTADHFISKSFNSPFTGRHFKGKIIMTIVGGSIVYQFGSSRTQ